MKIKLFKPLAYLKELIDYVLENPKDKIVTVKSSRQVGKSYTICNLLSFFCLSNKNKECIYFCPTYKQAKNVFKTITSNLKEVASGNASEMVITFPTGSTIQFLSAEQDEDSLRGYTCSGLLVYDEAAFLKDNVYNITRAYTLVHHPTMILISTPKFRKGRYYDYCMDSTIKTFQWDVRDNPYITEEQLELIRKETPANIFNSEYMNQWLEMSGEVFGDFLSVINEPSHLEGCYAGLDFGSGVGGDYTALSIFNADRQMVGIKYWNNLDADATIRKIIDVCMEYNITKLVAETNSIGNVYLSLLLKQMPRLVNLVKFTTSNDSKREIIENLLVAIQNKTITILNDDELLLELAAYLMQSTKTGKITYNGASGVHDDLVMATALALYNKNTKISWI